MTQLADANQRLIDRANEIGLTIDIVRMDQSTRTADDAAEACGCAVAQIVKSLVFAGADTGTPYLLLVSGANRVNEKGVAGLIGEALTRPDADFVRRVTGYAIGGIPPLAHDTPIKTYIDSDLMAFDTVWAAAGTPDSVFEIAPGVLAKAAKADPLDVKGGS